jgi:predicted nuclease with TOPRIM domain
MTSLVTGSENRKKSGGKRRYYVCSQHRKRGPCPYNKFHRVLETEERVERFVLGLLENPEVLREKVEEQAERERRALRNTNREARRIRQRLEKLEIMEDGYSEQQAEGLISMDRLREKLATLHEEHTDLQERLDGLADGEKRIAELEALPDLVESYLRDLPDLVARQSVVREYETVPAVRTADNPHGISRLTEDSIRWHSEHELTEKQRQATEERSQRFRELYRMLGLRVVCHPDLSLEVTWGADCSKWLGRV